MTKQPRFVVHEHHASRLHFDFRIEMDGVLKSWAIPKGPSMNPADKRLAIQVGDHTLEYGNFEGIIPKGSYGAGAVVIWDSGTYEVAGATDAALQWEQGSMRFTLHGRRLKGEFALVKLKGPRATGKEWLLMKKSDKHSDARFEITSALTPEKRKSLTERVAPCETS